jgi:DNA modification methylase
MQYQILQGDNRNTLRTIADNSVDAIVTDPPYGIDFLGKVWDANTGALETYQECLRVLKPGGHILAFSAARTYHHLAVTLEQAGFEIRDQIMWIYSSGFPKSQDVGRSIQRSLGVKQTRKVKDDGSKAKHYDYGMKKNEENDQVVCTDPAAKAWEGWGTSLKPAHEPICLARKPTALSIAKNVQQWGVGALNIDATRIPSDDLPGPEHYSHKSARGGFVGSVWNADDKPGQVDAESIVKSQTLGRFPSNVLGEILDYQKYFYCPKVSRSERHIGFEDQSEQDKIMTHWQMAEAMGGSIVDHEGNPTRSGNKAVIPGVGDIYTHGLTKTYEDWCKKNNKKEPNVGNNHPTVKPIELMKYLITLITPPGGTVLDPFNGSGSTGCAAVELGYHYIGCELDTKYVDISKTRIENWYKQTHTNTFSELFELC